MNPVVREIQEQLAAELEPIVYRHALLAQRTIARVDVVAVISSIGIAIVGNAISNMVAQAQPGAEDLVGQLVAEEARRMLNEIYPRAVAAGIAQAAKRTGRADDV